MTQQLMEKVVVVEATEYERGWGSKPDGYMAFRTRSEADNFVAGYHEKYNDQDTVPDWYMTQTVRGEYWATAAFMARFKANDHIIQAERVYFDRMSELEA